MVMRSRRLLNKIAPPTRLGSIERWSCLNTTRAIVTLILTGIILFTCLFTFGSCVVFLRTPATLKYSTYRGVIPFTFLFGGSITLALFFGILLRLYGLLSSTLREIHRRRGVPIALRFLRLAGGSLISYLLCLGLSRAGLGSHLSTPIAFIALIVLESDRIRGLISVLAFRLLPRPFLPYLIAKTSTDAGSTTSKPTLVVTTRRLLRYHSTAFVRVISIPDEDRDRRKSRDILLGLHGTGISLGFTVNFDGEFSILFSTTSKSYIKNHAEDNAVRRATVLEQVLKSQLSKSEIQAVQTEQQLHPQTGDIRTARILNETAEIETAQSTQYLGAVQIAEIAGCSRSPSPLYEALLRINLPATYQVLAEPITNPLQKIWATQHYNRSTSPRPPREREKDTLGERSSRPTYLYKLSALILLRSNDKETLNIALESLSAVARTTLSREDSTIKVTRTRGVSLLRAINSTRTYIRQGPYQLLTPEEATTTIQFPRMELPGIGEKPHPKLTLPEKVQETEVLELGEILRNGAPTGRPALIPVKNLSGHTLILGSTRSGKSNLVKNLLKQVLERTDVNFLVFDPHGEYTPLQQSAERPVRILDPVREDVQINLLQIPSEVDKSNSAEFSWFLENTIATVKIIFGGDWGPVLDGLAHKSLYKTHAKTQNPTITDWIEEAQTVAKKGDQRTRAALDSLLARLSKMTVGIYGALFNQPKTSLNIQELTATPTILNLSNLDEDAQRLLTTVLLKLILDHRKKNGPAEKLHLTVLEEAHNFAPRIYRATSSADEMSRAPAQKFLSELAKFNQAMILVDQRPSRITQDAIANCNTIITFHLQQRDDKNAVVAALGYNPYDPEGRQLSSYLSTLTTGEAIAKTPNTPYPFQIRTTPPKNGAPTAENQPPQPEQDKPNPQTPQPAQREIETLQIFQNKPAILRSEVQDQNSLDQLLIGELVRPVLKGEGFKITKLGEQFLRDPASRQEGSMV